MLHQYTQLTPEIKNSLPRLVEYFQTQEEGWISPLRVDVQDMAPGLGLVIFVPWWIGDEGVTELFDIYSGRKPGYNRTSCIRADSDEAAATDGRQRAIDIRVLEAEVRSTYSYLTDQPCGTEKKHIDSLASGKAKYAEVLSWQSEGHADIMGPDSGAVAQPTEGTPEDLGNSVDRQVSWLADKECVPDHVRQQVMAELQRVCGAVLEFEDAVTWRRENILRTIEALAAASETEPIHLSVSPCPSDAGPAPSPRAQTAFVIYTTEDFWKKVKSILIRQQLISRQDANPARQWGAPFHLYHLFQPVELAHLIYDGRVDGLLDLTKGE